MHALHIHRNIATKSILEQVSFSLSESMRLPMLPGTGAGRHVDDGNTRDESVHSHGASSNTTDVTNRWPSGPLYISSARNCSTVIL